MSKWAIIYSSVTGNTKMIAEAMAKGASEADVFSLQEAPTDFSGYEIVALGYWLRLGGPDPQMMKYLPLMHDAQVVLFQTHGTDKGSEHAVTAFARAAYLLGKNCFVLGTFSSQGKINPQLLEKRKNSAADDPHGSQESRERWARAASHPDSSDLLSAEEFARSMEHKLTMRAKYLSHGKSN